MLETEKRRLKEWFDKNTFHCEEFSDLKALLALKKKKGIKISVGIPTLNEEKTIKNIVRTIKKNLFDKKIIDEIAVIDSGSEDNTCRIAGKEGADIYHADNYIEGYKKIKGKGVNLWKSIYLLKGDIIVWIDGDIENIHPRFVYGLIGPLLANEKIKFVKAFYERPIKIKEKLYPTGGGRVTEILVKPLMNLFFPELSGMLQPLSGEYAVRRDVLEKIPFFAGYPVETGMLIDIHKRCGLDAIAQTNMGKRIHRNRRLPALKKMSFEIIQAFLLRAEQLGKLKCLKKFNKTFISHRVHNGGDILQEKETDIKELPPMIKIKEYRERWK